MIFNTGLKKYETADVDNFTSDIGIRLRRIINKPWRKMLKLGIHKKVIVEKYPDLAKDKKYIFCVNHSFDEDIISAICYIDRNVYMLHGTTHQMDHNPVFYALWLNGMIYVNRLNEESRKSAVSKMERILRAGSSIMLFPEGGYNNTENQLITPLFSSPYLLSERLKTEVVPFITFHDGETDRIYIRAGEPMALWQYEKYEALNKLRDVMSTIVYEIMEEHVLPIRRAELGEDPRQHYMEVRKSVYACQTWYEDVWDEEMTYYPGHGVTTPVKGREYIDCICVNFKNAGILADVLCRREEDKRYDLKQYMRDTFVLTPIRRKRIGRSEQKDKGKWR